MRRRLLPSRLALDTDEPGEMTIHFLVHLAPDPVNPLNPLNQLNQLNLLNPL
jgi:hypothetical protein